MSTWHQESKTLPNGGSFFTLQSFIFLGNPAFSRGGLLSLNPCHSVGTRVSPCSTEWPRAQRFACLYLPNAGIKGWQFHTQPSCIILILKLLQQNIFLHNSFCFKENSQKVQ